MLTVNQYPKSIGDGPQPIRGDEGASILGPRNLPLERENPDMLASPQTDHGTIPNLKFPFSAARNRLLTGGWAREVTVRELPIATTLAGVNMRLKPGGIRELHWHKEAEWAFMLAGRARITAVDAEGRNFIDDVGVGDLWNFPAGIPHSIQGLEEGCEFLLVFDNGSFSENETFLITDWFDHTPREVLAKNFGVPESAFDRLPKDVDYTRYIFSGNAPPPINADAVKSPAGAVPVSYSHRLLAQEPIKAAGGLARIVDSSNFPAATTIAAALVEVEPGGMRELHWHPTTDEWQYYISGRGRMTVFASGGKARTFDYQAGDVGYVPFAMGHYIENTGDDTLRFLEIFRSSRFADVSLNQWIGLTPPELVQAHLNLDQQTMAALRKDKPVIVGPQCDPFWRRLSVPASKDIPEASRPQPQRTLPMPLPEWPAGTIAVLSTVDAEPYAIPVTAPLRTGERRILISLKRTRKSLTRLRKHPQAALTILAKGDIAFTARGRAQVVQDPMVRAPEFAAVALDVEDLEDHRSPGLAVDSGVSLDWTNEATHRFLQQHLDALRELAAGET
jgi:oxalate decarboxylase